MASAEFSSLEYKLYGRQMILPELGAAGQKRLKNSHAVVIGAGALGSAALLYLAGAGVGTISVVDDDEVELSNLHRQIVHSFASVGNSKAESAATTLRALNPVITVRTIKERFTADNADQLLEGVDVLLDGSDNFATRYLSSAACARAGIAHVWAAILGFDAQMSVFWSGKGPVYEDLYPVQPDEGSVPNCATAGVLGALAGVVGSSMAVEALKILAGIGRPLLGEVGYYSALEGRWEYIPLQASGQGVRADKGAEEETEPVSWGTHTNRNVIKRNIVDEFLDLPQVGQKTGCTYAEFQRLKQLEEVVLLDVRESVEYSALSIPTAVNMPLSMIEKMVEQKALKSYISAKFRMGYQTVVVYCTGGPRAAVAARYLREAGCKTVYEMSDGLPGWLETQG